MKSSVMVIGDVSASVNGASKVTQGIVDFLRKREVKYEVVDSSSLWRGLKAPLFVTKTAHYLTAFFRIVMNSSSFQVVYIQIASGETFFLQTLFIFALSCKQTTPRFYIHHHSSSLIEKKSLARSFLFKLINKKSISIYLTSRMANNSLAKFGDHKYLVITNAYFSVLERRTDKQSPEIDYFYFGRLVFIGSISCSKGANVFLRIAKEGMRIRDNLKIFTAGPCEDPDLNSELERLKTQFPNQFTYIKSFDSSMLSGLLVPGDIFIFPSTYKEEAAPLVLYEALSLGVLCISSDAGYISEVVGEFGIVLPFTQIAQISFRNLEKMVQREMPSMTTYCNKFEHSSKRFLHEIDAAEKTLDLMFVYC